VKVFDGEGSIVPGDANNLFLSEVWSVNRVFWCVKEGARTVFDFFFGPLSFEDDNGFRSLRVAVGRKSGARSKLS
jgi:hypothetical protein